MRVTPLRILCLAACGLAALSAGCGDLVRQGRAPVLLVIDSLEGASGAEDSPKFGGTLQSDVVTIKKGSPTVFPDLGRVTMRLVMKDVLASPSPVNAVTINRYRITFRRSDGRSTPGVDVPQPFDSAATFTVSPGATSTGGFELVRHVAKLETPLSALAGGLVIISTVADVTFFGRDQVGNEVTASGSIGVQFGDFGDPD